MFSWSTELNSKLNMLPVAAGNYFPYRTSLNAELPRERERARSLGVKSANREDLFVGKLGDFNVFAANQSAAALVAENAMRMKAVFALRAILEIMKAWITFVSVFMVHDMFRWTWTDESLRYENVRFLRFLHALPAKGVIHIPFGVEFRLEQSAARVGSGRADNSASFVHPIQAFIANYFAPFHFRIVP